MSELVQVHESELRRSENPFRELPPGRREALLGDLPAGLLIDYGAELIKAGYNTTDPQLVFRPWVTKTTKEGIKQNPKASINTTYDQLEIGKTNLRSCYERNLIMHFGILEQCNDYIFGELLKPNRRLYLPLIISEPLGNLLACRDGILHQLFECYQVDSVMIGVDALFAYFYEVDCNIKRYQSETALLVHMGANTVHVLPVVAGKPIFAACQRLNLGGNTSFDLFAKVLLLKHPHLKPKLNYSFIRNLYEKFTAVAIDYKLQLKHFLPDQSTRVYRNRIEEANLSIPENIQMLNAVQINFDQREPIDEEIKRKEDFKKRMAQKLKETIKRRQQIKKKQQEAELASLKELCAQYEQHDKAAHEDAVEIFGNEHPRQKLLRRMKELQTKLGLAEHKPQEQKFALLSIPDHELAPDQLRIKKLQVYQKQAAETRRAKQQQQKEDELKMKELRENNPQVYLEELRLRYTKTLSRAKQNERVKAQLRQRKSKLKQRKMQALARLGEGDLEEEMVAGEDDWLVYKDLEESEHYSELEAMEAELREIDPAGMQQDDVHQLLQQSSIHLSVQRFKCQQIYFQPRIAGVNQCSLPEVVASCIRECQPNTKAALLKNIVLLGGSSVIPGMVPRLQREVRANSPIEMEVQVKAGRGAAKGAFLGMQGIIKHMNQFLDGMSFHREEWLRSGGFVAHPWSNPQRQQ